MYVTVVAVATSFVLYVPKTVPFKLTTSPINGLPSLEVPVPAVIGACKVFASVTTVFVVPSYTLLNGTLNPDIVNAFGIIVKSISPVPAHELNGENDKLK